MIINGKDYKTVINLGVLEDMEARGHDILMMLSGRPLAITVICDFAELAAGVPRAELRAVLDGSTLKQITDELIGALEAFFDVPGMETGGGDGQGEG